MSLNRAACAILATLLASLSQNSLAAPEAPPPQRHAITASPPELGPLFFTPKERAELDRIRAGISDSGDPAHAKRTVEFNGMLQRDHAAPILWINGQRYTGHEIAGAAIDDRALNASTIIVHLPAPDPRDIALKVGQTLDPAGGNLREVYQRPPQELNQLLQILAKRGARTEAASQSGQPINTAAPKGATAQGHR